MEIKETVSVVMTTYNGSKYIVEQLESLKRQTRMPNEVLIADDRSKDNTVEIVEKYITDNKLLNWTIQVNSENKGWRENFIQAASQASGDYIFFCDQDDIWFEDKIQIMVSVMERNKDINVLAGGYVQFQESIPNIKPAGYKVIQVRSDKHILYTDYPGCVYCIRKSFWNSIIRYWNGVFSHDAICWAVAKLQNSAYVLDRPVILWRRHYNSTYSITSRDIKHRKKRIEWLNAAQKNIECLREIAVALNFSQESQERINQYEQFNRLRIQMLTKRNPLLALKLLKYINYYNKKRQLLLEILLSLRDD